VSIIRGDFQFEVAAGDASAHRVSMLRIHRVSDWIYPETLPLIRSILEQAFPSQSYEVHLSTPTSAGEDSIFATITYTTKWKEANNAVGTFVPIPEGEIRNNLAKIS
jgi:hypothetical protein